MEREAIRTKVKAIIANVAGLDASTIGDDAALASELGIDSLSRLEIGVDVDYAFKLQLPDESFKGVDSVAAMVALVERRLAELAQGQAVGAA